MIRPVAFAFSTLFALSSFACSDDDGGGDATTGGQGSGGQGTGGSFGSGGDGGSATGGGSSGPTTVPEAGRLEGITAAHNAVRQAASSSIPDLVWDETLAGVAQDYADTLASRGCELEHSDSPYGENIYWTSGSSSADGVVQGWASEQSDYDYATNTCSRVCGHYTQIVWADSASLGCGVGDCPGGGEIWVCNYDPPGNWNGEKPY